MRANTYLPKLLAGVYRSIPFSGSNVRKMSLTIFFCLISYYKRYTKLWWALGCIVHCWFLFLSFNSILRCFVSKMILNESNALKMILNERNALKMILQSKYCNFTTNKNDYCGSSIRKLKLFSIFVRIMSKANITYWVEVGTNY